MSDELEPLILDLVEWVAKQPRPYTEVMEVWRTSCPRLPVWEDAVDRGLVLRQGSGDGAPLITATAAGLDLLERHGRRPQAGS
jgi:hypothetical protein